MTHNARIEAALADLESQDIPNYAATARKYGVNRITLARRWRGEQGTREEATATSRLLLNPLQEEELVQYILKLTRQGTSPTPHIVKNIAEELVGKSIGEDWTHRFIKRHDNRLHSIYLKSIDKIRQKADYKPYLAEYYRLVTCSGAYISEKGLISL